VPHRFQVQLQSDVLGNTQEYRAGIGERSDFDRREGRLAGIFEL
jgi:hypothetical protein